MILLFIVFVVASQSLTAAQPAAKPALKPSAQAFEPAPPQSQFRLAAVTGIAQRLHAQLPLDPFGKLADHPYLSQDLDFTQQTRELHSNLLQAFAAHAKMSSEQVNAVLGLQQTNRQMLLDLHAKADEQREMLVHLHGKIDFLSGRSPQPIFNPHATLQESFPQPAPAFAQSAAGTIHPLQFASANAAANVLVSPQHKADAEPQGSADSSGNAASAVQTANATASAAGLASAQHQSEPTSVTTPPPPSAPQSRPGAHTPTGAASRPSFRSACSVRTAKRPVIRPRQNN